MELTIEQALQKGIEAHKAGQIQEADQMYTAILKVQPQHPDANHNLGVLAVQLGKAEQALPFFEKALRANDKVEQYWLSYLDTLSNLGRFEEVEKKLEWLDLQGFKGEQLAQLKAKTKAQQRATHVPCEGDPPVEKLRVLLDLQHQGQSSEVRTKADQLLNQFPRSALLYNILGISSQALGQLDQAAEFYQIAIKLRPDYADSHSNLGNVQRDLGNLSAAHASCKRALELNPRFAVAHNNLGNVQRDLGDLLEAESSYRRALELNPEYVKAHNNLGVLQAGRGDFSGAERSYRRALELNPEYMEAHNNLGSVLQEYGDFSGAERSYRRALELNPEYMEAHNNLGILQAGRGDFSGAERSYRRALELNPEDAGTHRNITRLQTYNGTEQQIQQLQSLFSQANLGAGERAQLSFALGKIYDDLGDVEKAFAHFQAGNHLKTAESGYDLSQDDQQFISIREQFDQADLENLVSTAKLLSTAQAPIFILGMPRSGTTLVEQILSSHSQVFGAGELRSLEKGIQASGLLSGSMTQAKLEELRRNYLIYLKTLNSQERFITDKMPHNFRWIGWICLALPEAKIIHVKRSAMATCWSIYKRYFPRGHGYGCNLTDLGSYYKMYMKLMEYWRGKFPQKIYELNYEKLTQDQEQQTRKLMAYLGLTWEDACLAPEKNKRLVRTASNQQVRQRVYQGSSEHWKKYESFLGELKAELAGYE